MTTPPPPAGSLLRLKPFQKQLDDCIELPIAGFLEVFDVEHTGKGTMFEAEIYEVASRTLHLHSGCATRSSAIPPFKSIVNSTKEMSWWSANNLRQAGLTTSDLARAPPLVQVLKTWLGRLGGNAPVILAAHNAYSVDIKLVIWGLHVANVDPFEFLKSYGVVGVLETERLSKKLTADIKNELDRATQERVRKSKLGAGATEQPYGAHSNRNLYEVLCKPHSSQGAVAWHAADSDAMALAAWLTTRPLKDLLKGDLGTCLISLEQVVQMVYAKYKVTNSK